VDFVGADDQVVFFCQRCQIEQLFTVPAATNRVVRVAEQKQPGVCGQRRCQGISIKMPAIVGARELGPVQLATGKMGRGQKGRIDRRRRQYRAVDGPAGDVQAGDQPRQPDNPLWLNTPAVFCFEVSEY
jgi:hypothetical protein